MHQTVIIVDDNLLCARLYRAMLEPLACRVLIARNAQDAARLVGIGPDDDLLGDFPGLSAGWPAEDAETALPDPDGRARPLFVVSAAHQEKPVRQIARCAGGEALMLRKPVARDALASLVRRHLGAHH
jgi:CheY-like chemotaxis protein